MVIRRLLAIAFLPADMIEAEYRRQKLEMEPAFRIKLASFCKYFEKYWLKTVKPQGFSIYGLARRTNNCVESFHAHLQHGLEISPQPCEFLGKFFLYILV